MVQDLDADLLEVEKEKLEHFWEDPENVMHLVDLIFLMEDPNKEIVPSKIIIFVIWTASPSPA